MIELGKQYVEEALKKIGHVTVGEITTPTFKLDIEPEIPEEIQMIFDYLPVEHLDETEEKYIDALTLAAQTSYENGLYQFAYIQYHMLFMTAIYYLLLKVSVLHNEELKKAIYYLLRDRHSDFWNETNTKSGNLYFGSFAVINESEVFRLLRIIGLDDSTLGELQKLVKNRNRYAHANGQMQLTSDILFFEELKEYNTVLPRIFNLIKNDTIDYYKSTLCTSDFNDPDIRAYLDPDEQIIQEFIKKHSLSKVELNWLKNIKAATFNHYPNGVEIKNLHYALKHYYDLLISDDLKPIDDSYLLFKYKNNAKEFVENELGISEYHCVKNGGDFPVYECPECGEEQLGHDAENGKYHCFSCDEDFTDDDISFCERCGRIMRHISGQSLCQDCMDEVLTKE